MQYNPEVEILQGKLCEIGYDLEVDGYFGNQTLKTTLEAISTGHALMKRDKKLKVIKPVASKATKKHKEIFAHPKAIKTLVLDEGHGAIDPITGSDSEALTRVYNLPNVGKIYEGVINRGFGEAIKEKAIKAGFEVVQTAPTHVDTSLRERVGIANKYDVDSSYMLSIHNNGSASHTASGCEGYTTKGQNNSDIVMQCILSKLQDVTKLRTDETDGDLDREAQFYVIRNTKLRAGLMEIGFYDNPIEYKKLTDPAFIDQVAKAIVDGLIEYNLSLT